MYEWWPLAVSAFLGLSAGVALTLLGGVGVSRKVRMRVSELEGDFHSLSERITREQKRRASVTAADARDVVRSDKELAKEATERLAKENAGKIPTIGGFPSVFNRG